MRDTNHNHETFSWGVLLSEPIRYSKKWSIITAWPGRNTYVEYKKMAIVATKIESSAWVKDLLFFVLHVHLVYINSFLISWVKSLLFLYIPNFILEPTITQVMWTKENKDQGNNLSRSPDRAQTCNFLVINPAI